MSCGRPHEVDCVRILESVFLFLDGEGLDEDFCGKIRQHLDECGPCLREYGLEEVVKQLVHRCCRDDRAPQELRVKVMARIQEIRVELEVTEARAE